MPRRIPNDRFDQLIDAATRVFIENGYKRTQMADVAEVMGVAKGTVYLYVASKDALFDLTVRLADAPRPLSLPAVLPVPSPPPHATAEYILGELAKNTLLPLLDSFFAKRRRGDARVELEQFVRELYDELARHRFGLRLVDRSAPDLPELAALWFDTARAGIISRFAAYLEDRIQARLLRKVPDTQGAARVIIEIAAFWAVNRHWDIHPQKIDEATARDLVVHFAVAGLAKG